MTILMADTEPGVTRTRPGWSTDASLPALRQAWCIALCRATEVVGELAIFANGRELQRRLSLEIAIILRPGCFQSLLLAGVRDVDVQPLGDPLCAGMWRRPRRLVAGDAVALSS